MIGQYVNTGKRSKVTINPAVLDAQYTITAWSLGDGRRSATPAVKYVAIGEASECDLDIVLLVKFLCDVECKLYNQMNSWTIFVIVISK